MRPCRIVVVDDEQNALLAVRTALRSFKYENVVTCSSAEQLWSAIDAEGAEVVLLDIVMPEITGEQVLRRLKEEHPDIPVIMTTGVNDLETAVRCMRNGAFDYLVKPINRDNLRIAVDRALKFHELERCNEALAASLLNSDLSNPATFGAIKTVSPEMVSIFRYIEAIASSSYSILITGETGTGKELVAQAIHAANGTTGEFVPVNVAGLDDTVLADTLFGHEKGAYTGADRPRKGLVEQATKGTLFLDEIGDLSSASQVKLLRLLQENEYLPLGSDLAKRSNCRIIAATSRSLNELKEGNRFRKDLYYRLKTHHVHIPPLRDRKEDIPVLVESFLESAAKEFGKPTPTPPKEIHALLATWHFPGNVRELRAMIYDAVAMHQGRLMSLGSIREALGMEPKRGDGDAPVPETTVGVQFSEKLPTFKQMESILLEEALQRAGGNQALAASLLGVTRSAIAQRLKNARKGCQ